MNLNNVTQSVFLYGVACSPFACMGFKHLDLKWWLVSVLLLQWTGNLSRVYSVLPLR